MFKKLFKLHTWKYRNPFNRRCSVCGRHEVFHSYDPILTKVTGWWEIFKDGDSTAKPCGKKS